MTTVTYGGRTYDLSTYQGRQAARDDNPGTVVDAQSIYNPSGGGNGAGQPAWMSPATTGFGDGDMARFNAFAAATSGVTDKQLAQQKAEFDAQLAFAREQMEKLGIPQLQINQQLAALQQRQFLAQLAQVQASMTGYWTPPDFSNMTAAGGPAQRNFGEGDFVKTGAPGNWTFGQIKNGKLTGFPTNQAFFDAGGSWDPDKVNSYATVTPAEWSQMQQGTMPSAAAQGVPTLAAQEQWATLYGQNAPPTAGQQTLAAQLQAANIAAQRAGLTGQFEGAPTEAAREFQQQLALQQGQLGQQYLSTAAQLQGPQNLFQLSNYLRGAAGNPNVPVYLQALANNQKLPTFQGQGTTAPTAVTASGLTQQMGGQGTAGAAGTAASATPGFDYGQTLAAIDRMMRTGAQGLGPGTLEGLTTGELQALGSGMGQLGGSLPDFLQKYQQSRFGQTAPTFQTSVV